MESIDDHVAAERIIIAYNQGALLEGDCKCLLDQIRLAGAAAEREAVLAIATELPRTQVEGCWYVDLDELERRIRQRGEESN